jgi:hypothetical protein
MEQMIITSHSASELNTKLKNMIEQGWQPIGSHCVVETHHQLRFAGNQHRDTIIEREYSQTIKKD